MNIQQIEKHKETIQFFIDNPNKGLWTRNESIKEWRKTTEPSFSMNQIYVPNDDHHNLRKSLADGEIIEFNPNCNPERSGIWKTDTLLDFHLEVKNYRIKPKEPKIKMGDWVKGISQNITGNYNITNKLQLNQANEDSSYIKWAPIEDELCVFKEKDTDYYIVDQFLKTETYIKDGINTKCDKHWGKSSNAWFEEVYPIEYIDTLKRTKE